MLKVFLVCGILFSLTSCLDRRNTKQRQALSYYKKKYGLKSVEIVDSFKAGNSGLFGYAGVKDLAFEVSDGTFIYYDDYEDEFYDDYQAKQIAEDFETKLLPFFLEDLQGNYLLSDYRINATETDSFDECIFHEFYDGDIEGFFEKERPKLNGFALTWEEEDLVEQKETVLKLYEKIGRYLRGSIDIRIVKKGSVYMQEEERNSYIGKDDADMPAYAALLFDDKVYWYEPHYFEVAEGIFVSSYEANFELEEGDLVLEEVKGEENLQELLDEAYYALPVDAEENKDGSYHVHDRRHESRIVLDEEDLPYYRFVFSDRVLRKMGDDGFYVSIRIEEGSKAYPMYYRPGDPRFAYSLYQVCEPDGRIRHQSLKEGDLYCFGSFQREKYPGE
ncbi:MAG: hypothetical protein K5648_00640 [Erysipelotrichaceae bacterium]|nr:hypothetical protein [Erysipelotrichaceae bacterium]